MKRPSLADFSMEWWYENRLIATARAVTPWLYPILEDREDTIMAIDIDSIKPTSFLNLQFQTSFQAVAMAFWPLDLRNISFGGRFSIMKFPSAFYLHYGKHLNTHIGYPSTMRHRADRYIGFQLKPGENEAIEKMAKTSGLTKAELGRALLRAGKVLFEQSPGEVLTLTKLNA